MPCASFRTWQAQVASAQRDTQAVVTFSRAQRFHGAQQALMTERHHKTLRLFVPVDQGRLAVTYMKNSAQSDYRHGLPEKSEVDGPGPQGWHGLALNLPCARNDRFPGPFSGINLLPGWAVQRPPGTCLRFHSLFRLARNLVRKASVVLVLARRLIVSSVRSRRAASMCSHPAAAAFL